MSEQNPFHQRFNIEVDVETARARFVNRAHNLIIEPVLEDDDQRPWVCKWLFSKLGKRDPGYTKPGIICETIGKEFGENLLALEAVYEAFSDREFVENGIRTILSLAEVDLGIDWRDGGFIRKGAALLDQKLVNDPLDWLREGSLKAVVAPFDKALRLLLQAENQPHLRADVITDAYEALEALAKIVCQRDRDLSGNAELFIQKVHASDEYKGLLKEYIQYANRFRHAIFQSRSRPKLSVKEAESFVYLTGVFLRLACP